MFRDDDQIMLSATRGSQFTQSLMLFVRPSYLEICSTTFTTPQSQTQGGTRYTPHLTRFWASIAPRELLVVIESALKVQGVRAVRTADGSNGELRCRIGGLDHRHVPFKGWVIIELFDTANGSVRSFSVMQRDEVIHRLHPPTL
jgi:serine/threonine-protein kinase CHEK1